MSFQEQYDDNIFLSSTDEKEDFITLVSPGGEILLESQTAAIKLDYHMNPYFYAKNPDLNYLGHVANFNAHKTVWRHLTFRLEDRFLRSQELREISVREGEVFIRPGDGGEEPGADPTAFLTDTRFDLSIFIRNTLSGSVEWQYGRDDRLALGYTNYVLENENEIIPDEVMDNYTFLLEHWFGPKYGLLFDFGYLMYRSPQVSDYGGENASLRFTRRFSPHTSAYMLGGFLNRMFEEEETIDYQIYRSGIGLEHAFSPRFTGRVQTEYSFRDLEEGDDESVLGAGIFLTLRWRQMECTPFFRGGYVRDPKFAEFWSMGGALRYQPIRRFTFGIDLSYDTYYFRGPNLERWQGHANITYLPLDWLTTTLDLSHRERTESKEGDEYRNNRVLLRLTARY